MKTIKGHRTRKQTRRTLWLAVLLAGFLANGFRPSQAEDWPTYQHDNHRSGVSREHFNLPLQPLWTYRAPAPPQTAWPGPAKWDSYANLIGLKSMRDFDPVFFVTAVGPNAYFGSSVDDAVHCLDVESGKERWAFITDGPVRLPPAFDSGNLYFGSDDGRLYCVEADAGRRVWSYQPLTEAPLVPSYGKLISLYPCRTGALVQDSVVYTSFSLLPWKESFLCALDAKSGKDQGDGLFQARLDSVTLQGALLASSTRLYTSQGRQKPNVYDLKTGSLMASLGKSGEGGCYALLTSDNILFQGSGQNHGVLGEVRGFSGETQDHLATFPNANVLVIRDAMAYVHSAGTLFAFDRGKNLSLYQKKTQLQTQQGRLNDRFKRLRDPKGETDAAKEILGQLKQIEADIRDTDDQIQNAPIWKRECPPLHVLILADDLLFAGSKNQVMAFRIQDGEPAWQADVNGNAQGLTVANGRLFVSTDRGEIVCFRHAGGS